MQQRFLTLNAEVGEDSKIHFVFYTSAPKNRVNIKRIEKKFREQFTPLNAIEVSIFFAADVEDDIKESLLRKPAVEYGKIRIDKAGNYLVYSDAAVIVNVSAFSIKELYETHNITLLSRNLRYHINGGKIDKEYRKGSDCLHVCSQEQIRFNRNQFYEERQKLSQNFVKQLVDSQKRNQ